MTKLFIKTATLSLVIILFATSCTKTGATGPAGPAGSSSNSTLTGTIQGLVFLRDDQGVKQLGATVNTGDSVIITNNSSGMQYKTITDGTGTYKLNNIPAGTYSFTVSKPGYAFTKSFGFQFVGGGTTYTNFNLCQIPNATVTVTSVQAIQTTTASVNYIHVSGAVSAGPSGVIIYYSLPSNTSVNSTLGNYSAYFQLSILSGTTFYFDIPVSNLYNLGFTSGSTVYFAAYTFGNSGSYYADPLTGQLVYNAISSSSVNTFTVVP